MKKLIGYIIAIIGLFALALTMLPKSKTPFISFINIPQLSQIPDLYLTIGGLVLIILGILAVSQSSKKPTKTGKEVPIYHKDKIIGYRRH